MNCLEFRRRFTIDPAGNGPEIAAHRQQCPACDRFAERMGEFEKRLRQAMAVDMPEGMAERIGRRLEAETPKLTEESLDRHLESAMRVDVPEGLAGRILLRHSLERQRRVRRRWYLSAALAAGLALAVGLSIFWLSPGSHGGLAHEVVAHIEEDTQALLSRAQVRDFALSATLASFGMYLEEDIGSVTYAGICEVGTTLGVHLVVAGESGPVTVIVLPYKRMPRARAFQTDGYTGLLLPAHHGSIAVVAQHPQAVAPTAQRVSKALRWSL